MGSRDYRKRESKKPKKDAKKAPPSDVLQIITPVEVEVVRKKRKIEGIEEEREE